MSERTRRGLAAIVLIAIGLAGPGAAEAGCREGKPCRCGDKVRGAVTLTEDLVDCGRVGLKLDDAAVLDCAGHEIRGASPEESEYGVRFDDVVDAEVRNCRIRGFRRGVRIRGGSGNRVLANVLEDNGVGIEIAGVTAAGTASGHRIEKNEVRKSRRNGVHIGGAEQIVVGENRIVDSGQEGIHVESCDRCEVRGNTVESSRGPALYVKHSSGGRFEKNTIQGGLVQVRGDSAKNRFTENVLSGSAFLFQAYRGGRDGGKGDLVSYPRENEVVGGSVEGKKICFRFEGAHDNVVRGVTVRGCRPAKMRAFGEDGPPAQNRVEVVSVDGAPLAADADPGAKPAAGAPAGAPPAAAAAAAPVDSAPLAGLTEDELRRFRTGFVAFERVETPESGLGPVFNGTSCGECHLEPGVGGASDRTVRLVAGDAASPSSDLPLRARGVRTAACSIRGESPPEGAVVRRRVTPPLYGLGLIAAVTDEEILHRADPDDADRDGISGRPNRVGGRVGRFGWKAQDADLRAAVARALRDAIGITSPLHREEAPAERAAVPEGCDAVAEPEDDGTRLAALVDFLEMLAPLAPPPGARDVARGEALFREAGCSACHVAELQTGDSPLAPLRRQPVELYSDLLLHDLGTRLADGIAQGDASGVEFRTAPLWGIGQRRSFLHDGRAPTLGAAISLHGGEATAARERFLALSQPDRKALEAFLESL
jgi:parallel beta-helix repeat protein